MPARADGFDGIFTASRTVAMDDHHAERPKELTERACAPFPDERLDELTERAWALGYRLIKRNHDYLLGGIHDYVLWGVHQRRPILATHTAGALDGDRGIAEVLAEIAKLPCYCLQLQDNPGIEVTANTSGRRIIRDTATRDFFMLMPGEHEDATQLIVYARYPPSIGNWSCTDD
jgi:hypothetical protein